nr:hypothetical protein BaRGS_002467 [Batillaria attramentaria]
MPTPVFARFTSAQNTIRRSSLTHRQITTFLSEFFAAGVDTTGHYLAFSLYALARHQNVQEKLYNEIKHVTDTDMAGGALESMQYLRSFMKESLRNNFVSQKIYCMFAL